MSTSLHASGHGKVSRFWRDEAHLRREVSRMAAAAASGELQGGANRLEALLAGDLTRSKTARADIAASAALLPIAPEMVWALPQLLKRIQLVAPGTLSTSGALRALIRMPERDAQFANAFTDSGFLSCHQAIERVHWKYDIGAMVAKQIGGSAWHLLEHCRDLLTQHRTRQPFDLDAVLIELQTLRSWFPELRTIQLLEQLYARLHVLHVKSVLTVQCWLEWRAGVADAIPNPGHSTAPVARTPRAGSIAMRSAAKAFAFQGVHDA
jgi:hypothetical protein